MTENAINVLVIDDEPGMLEMFKFALQSTGVQVTTVQDSKDVFIIEDLTQYTHAFVDVIMPDINGVEVIEYLRAHNPKMIITAMTGYIVREAEARLDELGITTLHKPFPIEEMLAIVEKDRTDIDGISVTQTQLEDEDVQTIKQILEYYQHLLPQSLKYKLEKALRGIETERQELKQMLQIATQSIRIAAGGDILERSRFSTITTSGNSSADTGSGGKDPCRTGKGTS